MGEGNCRAVAVWGEGGLGVDGSVQHINRGEELNPDVDPHRRVMERLCEFLCENNIDGSTFQKVAYGR